MVIGLEREGERVVTSRTRARARLTPNTAVSGAVTRDDTSLHSKIQEALRPVVRGAVSPCHLALQLTVSDIPASLHGVAMVIDELKGRDITRETSPSSHLSL